MDSDESHVSQTRKGQLLTLRPGVYEDLWLTTKSDVSSFGVSLVEIPTGHRPVELKQSFEERARLVWVC